eukprot:m.495259 g.495259  ORF g.495259 m.495259 type:complete len:475 (-) comp21798_c0_seq2:186-1610(-)
MKGDCRHGHTWVVAGLALMVLFGVAVGNQIRNCDSTGTSTCMDDYDYVGPTGLDCADWYHRGCSKASSDASFSSSDVAKLWNSCPQSCKTCTSCTDTPSFSDIFGYTCRNWAKYNCSKAVSKYGYTAIQERLVIQNCRSSCNHCDDIRDSACSFPFTYNGVQYSTCINRGSNVLTECRTHSGSWKVCIPQGTPCVIPFKYDGIKYTGCTVHGTDGKFAWCATKTDRNNYMVPGHWAACQNCNLSQVLETQGCNGTDGFSVAGPTRNSPHQTTTAPQYTPQEEDDDDSTDMGNPDGETGHGGNNGDGQQQDDVGGQDDMGGRQDDMGGGQDDMGGGQDDMGGDQGMNRRRVVRNARSGNAKDIDPDVLLQRARRIDCGTHTTHTRNKGVDQANNVGDPEPSLADKIKANPAIFAMTVVTVVIAIVLLILLAVRGHRTWRGVFPDGYEELRTKLNSQHDGEEDDPFDVARTASQGF